MDNRNFNQTNFGTEKSKAKTFWANVGIVFLALGLSILTVLVINLNR